MRENSGKLKSLYKLHKVMLMALLIITFIAVGLVSFGICKGSFVNHEKIIQLVVVVVSIGGFYIGLQLFSKKLKLINASGKQLQDKISTYKSTCIIQWALIDIPAIFSLIGFLLTTNYAFLLLDILLIIVFTVLTPSKMKIIFQLRLNQQEAAQL